MSIRNGGGGSGSDQLREDCLAADMRIVGIGASAGGIEALRGFFQHVPPRNGIAFVVVLHLAPDHTSMLAEVLGNWTQMPVREATDGSMATP